jgi:hypothetical protein
MRLLKGRELVDVTFSRNPTTMIRDIVCKSNGREDTSACTSSFLLKMESSNK